jgi:RRXRR protein/HNH endonuclease
MPCTQSKARLLLKEGKAKIYCYKPFTIQLNCATGETVQDVHIGIDSGAKYVGIAIISENKVLIKGEIELRSDIKELLTTKKTYRRSRRNRKTRYRKPRFQNRTRKNGWLPPSIQSRIDNQISWINKIKSLLPNPKVIIEVGKFDAQKIINPSIEGEEYQQGDTYGFWNDRYYIFCRDNYKCQICKGKSKDKILQTHHIIQRKNGGTDKVDNLVTVCKTCHNKFHSGEINHKFKKPKQYKETVFMNVLRKHILNTLDCEITYGSVTIVKRKELELEKSHYNDAIAISGITNIKINHNTMFYIKQFRKKKRSLHEATARKGRKTSNTESNRNSKNTKMSKGFYLNDKVKLFNKVGYISGFASGGAYVKDLDDNYIVMPNKNYKQVSFKNLEFISHNNNWNYEERICI